jgi:STE24 endopeptidase
MANFDPAAATAAYLAQIPPDAQAKAIAYTHGSHWIQVLGVLVTVVAAWLILRTGVLAGLRARLERARPRPLLAALVVVFVGLLLQALLETPWEAYSDWARDTSYGLTSQSLGGWLTQHAIEAAITTVLFSLAAMGLYAIVRKSPRRWWLWGSAVTAVFVVIAFIAAPILIAPLFNTYKAAPPGPMRDEIVRMAEANNVPSDQIYIYDGSKQSNRYTANVSGLFGTARISMSDVMFKKGADLAEVRGVVGHEMGHYVRMHVLVSVAGYSLMALVFFLAIDRLFPVVLRLTGAKGVTGLADPAGLPVVVILIALLGLLTLPLVNAISRFTEADADRFSLERINEPDGLAQALVKTAEYRAPSPGRLEEAIFYTHPSVGRRVRNAMDWKAAHPKAHAP